MRDGEMRKERERKREGDKEIGCEKERLGERESYVEKEASSAAPISPAKEEGDGDRRPTVGSRGRRKRATRIFFPFFNSPLTGLQHPEIDLVRLDRLAESTRVESPESRPSRPRVGQNSGPRADCVTFSSRRPLIRRRLC